MDQLAYYKQNPKTPLIYPDTGYVQENRPTDDSIPLLGSIPHTDRIRVHNNPLPPLSSNRRLPSRTHTRILPHRRGMLSHAYRETRGPGQQEEASPRRNGHHYGPYSGNWIHQESTGWLDF